jgi:hypothetical protein
MNSVFPVLTLFFHAFFLIVLWRAARSAFDLQEGVIRQRSYTFYTLMVVTLFFAYYFSPFSFLNITGENAQAGPNAIAPIASDPTFLATLFGSF